MTWRVRVSKRWPTVRTFSWSQWIINARYVSPGREIPYVFLLRVAVIDYWKNYSTAFLEELSEQTMWISIKLILIEALLIIDYWWQWVQLKINTICPTKTGRINKYVNGRRHLWKVKCQRLKIFFANWQVDEWIRGTLFTSGPVDVSRMAPAKVWGTFLARTIRFRTGTFYSLK